MSNNLQVVNENEEGEVHAINDNMDMEAAQDYNGNKVQQIENNINLVQGTEYNDTDRIPGVEYENDEDTIVCGRFPHLDVCVCEINCDIALKEINLF
jgi:hypothetical protein